jgi:hypothetical protein
MTRTELLHYFREKNSKDKKATKRLIERATRYKESKSGQGSNRMQRRGQFREHIKNKPAGSPSKSVEPAKTKKNGSNRVSLGDKCPIHPDGNHKWGDCYQNILNKDKKSLQRVRKRVNLRLLMKLTLWILIHQMMHRLMISNSPEMNASFWNATSLFPERNASKMVS